MEPKNALVIGAGNRVKSTVLPALQSLGLPLIGVVSRHRQDLGLWWHEPLASTQLGAVDVQKAGLIVVSVPPKEVPAVLRQLAAYDTSRATLVLETPVVHPFGMRGLRLTRRYRRAVVAEDFLTLRLFDEARRCFDTGKLGAPTKLHFHNFGGSHHVVALARQVAGARTVSFAWRNERAFSLRTGGVSAVLDEPGDYHRGTFTFFGTRGSIGTGPEATVRLEVSKTAQDGYAGLRMQGAALPATEEERLYREAFPARVLQGVRIHEPLWLNEMKVHALMRILTLAAQGLFAYGPLEGLYDSLPAWSTHRCKIFADLPLGTTSLVREGVRLISAV